MKGIKMEKETSNSTIIESKHPRFTVYKAFLTTKPLMSKSRIIKLYSDRLGDESKKYYGHETEEALYTFFSWLDTQQQRIDAFLVEANKLSFIYHAEQSKYGYTFTFFNGTKIRTEGNSFVLSETLHNKLLPFGYSETKYNTFNIRLVCLVQKFYELFRLGHAMAKGGI